MESIMPLLAGVLYAASMYMMLQRNIVKLAIGLILLTNATNMFLFTAGRLTRSVPPLIAQDAYTLEGQFANPVSEALILTAIVIGFGLFSFILALIYGLYVKFKTLDPHEIDEDLYE